MLSLSIFEEIANIRSDGNGSDLPFASISSVNDLSRKLPQKVIIDTTTLIKSRRVAPKVCSIINDSLGTPIESASNGNGEIKWLNNISEAIPVLMDSNIPKLVWENRFKCPGVSNFINWSYSKGDTYLRTCIILTESTSSLSNWDTLSNPVRNRLYVALTRSLGDVYLISSNIFAEYKNSI